MINLAIIGLGYWGPNFIEVIAKTENAKLIYCCDISKESLKKIARKYDQLKITTNLDEVLKDNSIDSVIVTTPASQHYKIVKKAIIAGKDVLVEKPLATTKKHALELVNLAKKNKRILMVDHIFLFNAAIRKIKEVIDQGELGSIFYGHGDYTALGPIRVDVSAMTDLAVHFIYVTCYLLNSYPSKISAFGKALLSPKNVDVAFINLEFQNKAIFNLRVSWIDPVKTRSLSLVGDKKMVMFDDTQIDKVKIFNHGVEKNTFKNPANFKAQIYNFTFRYGEVTLPYIQNSQPLSTVLSEFIESVQSRKPTIVSPEDAINMVTILEAAENSLKSNGKKIKLSKNINTKLLSFRKK